MKYRAKVIRFDNNKREYLSKSESKYLNRCDRKRMFKARIVNLI